MSAIVCGSKRSYYHFHEDLPSPPLSKRHRYASSSSPPPPRFSPPSSSSQLVETALDECGNNFDSAIKNIIDDRSSAAAAEEAAPKADQCTLPNEAVATPFENISPASNLPADGAEWVDLFVREMMSATSFDDAKARASRVLEVLERSVRMRAAEETEQSFQKDNMMLKEQIETLMRENAILKRAVAIQHERQKEFEDKNQELQQLKQLVSQYHEQLRTLEVNNYALLMHLRQAEQSNPIPGRFHPDVF